jgi:hypothetical protein
MCFHRCDSAPVNIVELCMHKYLVTHDGARGLSCNMQDHRDLPCLAMCAIQIIPCCFRQSRQISLASSGNGRRVHLSVFAAVPLSALLHLSH